MAGDKTWLAVCVSVHNKKVLNGVEVRALCRLANLPDNNTRSMISLQIGLCTWGQCQVTTVTGFFSLKPAATELEADYYLGYYRMLRRKDWLK